MLSFFFFFINGGNMCRLLQICTVWISTHGTDYNTHRWHRYFWPLQKYRVEFPSNLCLRVMWGQNIGVVTSYCFQGQNDLPSHLLAVELVQFSARPSPIQVQIIGNNDIKLKKREEITRQSEH